MNKRDDLCMRISGKEPDIMLITEVLPKAQFNAIPPARFAIHGYKTYFSFAPDDPNLSIKKPCGICIYVCDSLPCSEVNLRVLSVNTYGSKSV